MKDPVDGQMKPANIWCSGQSMLADGRVLVTGGNLSYDGSGLDFKGLNKVYTFNPWNETWTEQPDMRHGRWYPSQTTLPDGRAVILSGFDETGGGYSSTNKDIEIFTPSPDLDGRGTITLLGERAQAGTPPDGGLYPHTFVMPSGRVLIAGPDPNDSWFLRDPGPTNTFAWDNFLGTAGQHLWGTAVLLPDGPAGSTKVEEIGGSNLVKSPAALATSEIIDENNLGAGWQPGPSLNIARSHHNTVLLPDGSMVTVGGGVGRRDPEGQWAADPEQRQVELYDPSTNSWRLGAAQAEARAYHSTAVLLPDGRVISAGDDYNGGIDKDTAEIYEPPYLFKGPRPTVTSAPGSISLGQSFSVATPDTDIAKAVLVAPGATTHANDMNQRLVPLSFTERTGAVDLLAPANGWIAPPGYYMLFLVNDAGVPSIARWVRLVPGASPPAPAGLVAAYSFDEGSGTTAADSSGKGNAGAVSGATWTAVGRNGGAL
ncbi:MAG TPA: galactose oxidase-like domain-containing protein, partial [Solirubrobacterales bacterium]